MKRSYRNVELKGNDAKRFKSYCKNMHLSFETSEAGYGYTHFEVLVDDGELKKANEFLNSL